MTPGHLIILNRRKTKKNRIISSIWPWTKCTKCMCSKMSEPFSNKSILISNIELEPEQKKTKMVLGCLGSSVKLVI